MGRAGVIAAGTLTSRLLGVGREQAIAALFTRVETDAYVVAMLLPNLLRQLLAEGASQNAILPVLSETREQAGDAAARTLYRRVLGLWLCILAGVSLAGVLAAPWLVRLVAAGYAQTPGHIELTTRLARWMFPYIFFMGLAALGLAGLNAYRRFVVAAFAPALLNVSLIFACLALPSVLQAWGQPAAFALAVGVLVGGALQVIAQWPSLKRVGLLSWPRLRLNDPRVRAIMLRLAPVTLGLGIYLLDMVVARRMIATLPSGSMSHYQFALRLRDLPQGIFVLALQSATLPSLSALAQTDQQGFNRIAFFGLRLSLFVSLAASVALVVLAEPLVTLVFERGNFGPEARVQTAGTLVALGSGLWAVAMLRQLTSIYYALGRTRAPVAFAAAGFFVFLVLALLLIGPFGLVGVAWAVAGAEAGRAGMVALGLRRHLRPAPGELVALGRCGLQTLAAAVPAALLARALAHALTQPGAGPWQRMLPGFTAALAFALAFAGIAWAFRLSELRAFLDSIRRRRPATPAGPSNHPKGQS